MADEEKTTAAEGGMATAAAGATAALSSVRTRLSSFASFAWSHAEKLADSAVDKATSYNKPQKTKSEKLQHFLSAHDMIEHLDTLNTYVYEQCLL